MSDDSADDVTAKMIAAEFPSVTYIRGPRSGRSGNRNCALRSSRSDYAMMCDDDVQVDPTFAEVALERVRNIGDALVFPAIEEHGHSFLPNGLDFLGFATIPYQSGMRQHTAHSQCFVVSRNITDCFLYDEIVSTYGYEEFDFVYRVAAAGFPILPTPECVCVHTAPAVNKPLQQGADANRLYVTFKRHFYVDRRRIRGLRFAAVAIPHHFVRSFQFEGFRGLGIAWSNVRQATSMLRRHLRMTGKSAALQQPTIPGDCLR